MLVYDEMYGGTYIITAVIQMMRHVVLALLVNLLEEYVLKQARHDFVAEQLQYEIALSPGQCVGDCVVRKCQAKGAPDLFS
jgi:hypothetical protein